MYVVETMNMGYTFLSLGNLWIVGKKATRLNADEAKGCIGCVVLRDLSYWCVAAHAENLHDVIGSMYFSTTRLFSSLEIPPLRSSTKPPIAIDCASRILHLVQGGGVGPNHSVLR